MKVPVTTFEFVHAPPPAYVPLFETLAAVAFALGFVLVLRKLAREYDLGLATILASLAAWFCVLIACVMGWVSTPNYYGGAEFISLLMASIASAFLAALGFAIRLIGTWRRANG